MFSWKKEKDAEEGAVAAVQKKMKQRNVPRLPHKMRMRSDVVAVLKTHPSLQVKLDASECLPQIVREKVKAWQGVQVLKLEGNVVVDSSSEYSIPLKVVVHPSFPSVFPICLVTGDLYIPKWTAESTLATAIGDIIREFASSSVSRRHQRSVLSCQHQQQEQVLGLILADDAEIDWQVFESAVSAASQQHGLDARTWSSAHTSAHASSRAASSSGLGGERDGTHLRSAAAAPQQHGDDDIDWEVFEAVRAVEEAERREQLAAEQATRASQHHPQHQRQQQQQQQQEEGQVKHGPLFRGTEETPSCFVCPISLEVMSDPVTAADGHTYEREEVEDWLRKHSTSPLTNMELPHKMLTPNTELQQQIHAHFRRADPGYHHRFMHF